MDDTIEVEIKIEYNESFDTDPLCDKNVNYVQSNVEIGCLADENDHIPTSKANVAASDETCSDFNNEEIMHTYNNHFDNATNSEVSWYESIDDSGRFLCKFCNLKYSTLQTLRFHVKNKHTEQATNIKENLVKCKRNSKLKCHICKQRFKEIFALKNHVDNYHSLTDIKTSCLYCDATFSTENEMSDHLYIQHKKVNYKSVYLCNLCGYRTSTKSHYNQHKNTHIGAKTMKCQYCDYATNYLPNLKIHERIHTNDKVYVCDFVNCQYRCSAKSALRSHQLKHCPEENALYCDKCSYKTIYRQSLKRHEDCHKRNSVKLKLS